MVRGRSPSPDTITPPDVMTVEQLSVYLQIAKSTIYKLAQEGKVPGQKIGKHWRFRKGAIDAWLEERGPCADFLRHPKRESR